MSTQNIKLTDFISAFIPADNKERWSDLKESLALSVPKPDVIRKGSKKITDILKNLLNWTANYEWEAITAEQFVAAICANNYPDLIDRNNIRSKYKIYIAVSGLTVEKIGVDYYEIAPDKSFTTDLGVD